MADVRIIKKYPNRRLYDTAESKYITLEDVRKLVADETPFAVVDKKTGDDITRSILLQIIMEQEDGGEPIFSSDMLQQLISFYGNSMENMASDFLERSVSMFKDQQETFQKQVAQNPLETMTEMTQANLQRWQKMQEDFFKTAWDPTANKDKSED